MRFRKEVGKKAKGDEKLLVKTEGWEAITLVDIARIVVHHYHNEDLLYPQGRGGELVFEFLRDCVKNPDRIDWVASQYKLSKGVVLRLRDFM